MINITTNNEQTAYYVGIDQHKDYSLVVVIDSAGKKLDEQKLYHHQQNIMTKYFKRWAPGLTTVALEATGSWYWLYDLLESLNLSVKLVHPLKVKLIAESTIKTDRIDAYVLANLLRTGYLPTAYIPGKDIRELRERLRHRIVLVRQRTSLKNRIEAVLVKLGIIKPADVTNSYSSAGKKWLRSLGLSEAFQMEINNYLELIEKLTGLIKSIDQQIKECLERDKRAEYLMSIPGIGYYTAYLILAEIGDIQRFASPKKLTSYAGLVPSVNQSGKHVYFGRITKQGDSYIRCALVESSHIAVRHDSYFGSKYRKLKAKKGTNKAIVAVARELLEIIYWILKQERVYYNRKPLSHSEDLVMVQG